MNHYNKNPLSLLVIVVSLITIAFSQTGANHLRGLKNDRENLGGNKTQSNSNYARQRLTGTWRLNQSRSDDPRIVAERATRNDGQENRGNLQDNIMRRLEAPDTLMIERRGQSIIMASNRAPQVSFEADGKENAETLRNGRQRYTRASIIGERLMVRTTGDRGSDFEVTFEPIDGGRRLRVTRSLYTERLNKAITSRSVYDRIADSAQFNSYDDPNNYSDTRSNNRRDNFIIADGSQVVATLDNNLRTKDAKEGDTFTLTVRQPNQYSGAVIQGRVLSSDRSGRVSGRAGFQLQMEQIRLRDGRSYEFAGTIDGVRTTNGDNIRVDTEGSVAEDTSQTNRTVQRSAIGGAIGAIIGAIAGGGKGAAIGAVVGAGAGAGSIYVQGRDDLELERGTEFTIRASTPR